MIKVKIQDQEYAVDLSTLKKIGRGGEGEIFLVMLAGQQYALKLYFKPNEEKREKITAMLENSPDDAVVKLNSMSFIQLAWPVGVAYKGGQFVGFVMPYVDLSHSSTLDFYLDQRLYEEKFKHVPLTLSYRIEIARNLAGVIKALHARNHFFIDFKPQNVRVYDRYHLISLIDCDGFSISGLNNRRFPASSYSSEYICPSAIKNNSQPASLAVDQDLFALAVVIFQILNFGIHPFSGLIVKGDGATTTDEKVEKGYYPYGKIEHPNIKPIKNSAHFTFSDELRTLFDQSFGSSTPVSVNKWIEVLDKLLSQKLLVKCSSFPTSAEHIHFDGKECPACFRSKATSRVKVKSTVPSLNISSNKGSGPWTISPNASGFNQKFNTPSSIPGKILGMERGILVALLIFAIVAVLINLASKPSGTGSAVTSNSNRTVNILDDIAGSWEMGSTCSDHSMLITSGGAGGGYINHYYSDSSKNSYSTISSISKNNQGFYDLHVLDGVYTYDISYKKLNQNQLKIMRAVYYANSDPSNKTALVLNGMTVESGEPTFVIDRCK